MARAWNVGINYGWSGAKSKREYILEELIFPHIVKKFHTRYENWTFNTTSTKANVFA